VQKVAEVSISGEFLAQGGQRLSMWWMEGEADGIMITDRVASSWHKEATGFSYGV